MMKKALAVGCSHTAGVGVALSDVYVTVLERLTGVEIINAGQPGRDHYHCESQIVGYLSHSRPAFIIAQWPNPIRKTLWVKDIVRYETVGNASDVFKHLLAMSDRNFFEPWLQSIITCNLLATLANVPIINISLENEQSIGTNYLQRLAERGIELHIDEKRPGHTWLFDSAASDNLHHSAACHAAWADRILGILNENT